MPSGLRTAQVGRAPQFAPRLWMPFASPPCPQPVPFGSGKRDPRSREVRRKGWWGRSRPPAAALLSTLTPTPGRSRGSDPRVPRTWRLDSARLLAAASFSRPSRKGAWARGSLGTLVPKEGGRQASVQGSLPFSLSAPRISPQFTPPSHPGPLPGSGRQLHRNPVPAWPRLGFAQAKQEMCCSRSTSLL